MRLFQLFLDILEIMKRRIRLPLFRQIGLNCLIVAHFLAFSISGRAEPIFPQSTEKSAEMQRFWSHAAQPNGGVVASGDTERKAETADFNPLLLVKFSKFDAAMIGASGVRSVNQGLSTYSTSARLSAVFFTKVGDVWIYKNGTGDIGESGFGGFAGAVSVRQLTAHEVGVDIVSQSCSQGICGKWLSVIRLTPTDASLVGDRIPLAADNVAAVQGCDVAIASGAKMTDGAGNTTDSRSAADLDNDFSSLKMDDCFRVVGKVGFSQAGARLKIHFHEEFLDSGLNRYHQNDSTVEYFMNHGKYVLFRGKNPVPKL